MNLMVIIIASFKKEGYNKEKVKYEFFNPIPEYINQKINVLKICKEEKEPKLISLEESSNNYKNNTKKMKLLLILRYIYPLKLKKKQMNLKIKT